MLLQRKTQNEVVAIDDSYNGDDDDDDEVDDIDLKQAGRSQTRLQLCTRAPLHLPFTIEGN